MASGSRHRHLPARVLGPLNDRPLDTRGRDAPENTPPAAHVRARRYPPFHHPPEPFRRPPMTTDTTEEIAVLARLAALPPHWMSDELHAAAINSRSAVLIGLWSLSAQFRIRIAQNLADTRKEIPGNYPSLSAVLLRPYHLAGHERSDQSYLFCSPGRTASRREPRGARGRVRGSLRATDAPGHDCRPCRRYSRSVVAALRSGSVLMVLPSSKDTV
jgi:hypothetical protein